MGNERLTRRVTGSGLIVLAVILAFQNLASRACSYSVEWSLVPDKRIAASRSVVAAYTQWFTHAQ